MSKIALIAEKINNELLFIKKLREIASGKSIGEIKDCLKRKKAFFCADEHDEETEIKVKEILHFTEQNGDIIRLFQISDDSDCEDLDENDEISREVYENQQVDESCAYLDELEAELPYVVRFVWNEDAIDTVLRWCWKAFGPCYGIKEKDYPGQQFVLATAYVLDPDEDNEGVWLTFSLGEIQQIIFKHESDRDAFIHAATETGFCQVVESCDLCDECDEDESSD